MNDPNGYGNYFLKSSLKGSVTVDITNTDNGFLDCSRKGSRQSHATTDIAVSNLEAWVKPNTSATIIGHGNPGLIITGTGQSRPDRTKYIELANKIDWERILERLKPFKISNLYLFGCDTGAEQEGADLLFEISKIINADVVAPTGRILCDRTHFTLEATATWQIATPHSKPDPIEAPRSPEYEYTKFNMFIRKKNYIIPIKKEQIIRFFFKKPLQEEWTQLPDGLINEAIKLVDFSNPIDLRGIPSGLITEMFKIDFKDGDGTLEKEYHILNNRLAVDKEFPLLGYFCKSNITEGLNLH